MSALNYQTIAHLMPATTGKIYIAFSGGIDSHVLLHLCATQAQLKPKIVAVYVNHGLQAPADAWGEHCRHQAQVLDVDFVCLKVDAKAASGESPEAAARNARYQAMKDLIKPDDLLLLAQHREDQMETVLLQLFRGAGIQGLAAMPILTTFGSGILLRPLLLTAKSAIQKYARLHTLQWVEDPSNQSSDFDRNYLRNEVVPLLKQRWPSLDKTVARSAQHCGEAVTLLNEWGKQRLAQSINSIDKSLSLDTLKKATPPQKNWLIKQWFDLLGLKPPSQALLQAINEHLIEAREDARPQIYSQGHYLKRYRQRLFCIAAEQLVRPTMTMQWPAEKTSLALPNGYVLSRVSASTGIKQQFWHSANITLKPRNGGEKIKLPGRKGQHSLKKLFQEAGIPPWEREIRPLIYLEDKLAAVAGLWIAEWAWSQEANACYQLTWQRSASV